MKFSSTLKELREQNHVTQNQLASHLKLTFGFQTTAFRIHRISTRSGYKKGKDAKINCAFFPFFFNFYSPPSLLAVNHPRQNVTIPTTIVNTESPLQSTFNKIAIGDARIRPMIA